MAVTNYMTVNGKIRSEHRAGEAHARDYMHAPSGNVIGVYVNGWLNADACYTPWGGTLASWNMGSSYKFTWMGGWGYRQTGLEWSSTYVRARHYSHRDGAWTSRDPLWPSEMPYGYVEGRVPGGVDYWGERRRKNNRKRGEPNKGINTRGQHGNPRRRRAQTQYKPKLGTNMYGPLRHAPLIDDIIDWVNLYGACVGMLGSKVLTIDSHVPYSGPVLKTRRPSSSELKEVCLSCCRQSLRLSMDTAVTAPLIAVGMGYGGIVGGIVGNAPGAVVGGTLGGVAGSISGSMLGDFLGDQLADNLCPIVCSGIPDDCSNGGPWTPFPDPLAPIKDWVHDRIITPGTKPINDIWPTQNDWRWWLSPPNLLR